MIFIETPVFSGQLKSEGIDDEQLRSLQNEILEGKGDVMPRTGGFMKIRLARKGGGKSGGYRLIFYLMTPEKCYLLFLYPKNKQANLTPEQAKRLRVMVE